MSDREFMEALAYNTSESGGSVYHAIINTVTALLGIKD